MVLLLHCMGPEVVYRGSRCQTKEARKAHSGAALRTKMPWNGAARSASWAYRTPIVCYPSRHSSVHLGKKLKQGGILCTPS